MDLSKIKPLDTIAVDLRDPESGELIGVTVNMRHKSSPQVQAVYNAFQRRIMQQRARATPEDLVKIAKDQIVAAVASWEWKGDANWNGVKPTAFSEPIMREMLELDWAFGQLSTALADEAAFFRRDQ